MIKFSLLVFLYFYSLHAAAHGLDINTANVFIRNESHLILRIQYKPLRLLNRMQPDKKFPLAFWANMSEQQLEQHYQQIQELFQNKLSLKIDDQALQSVKFHFPKLSWLKNKIREHFMQKVIDQERQAKTHQHKNLVQLIRIDAFFPENKTKGQLMINFPAELGEIMVTYSKPISQTLKPQSNQIVYRQVIDD